jgi:endonuclease/exonuclease/phosphatase family metal-dependent hydrolase
MPREGNLLVSYLSGTLFAKAIAMDRRRTEQDFRQRKSIITDSGLRALFVVLLAVLCIGIVYAVCQRPTSAHEEVGGNNNTFLFCFWNVENLFDDHNDGRTGTSDVIYDPWFAENPDILQLKLSRLTEVLAQMNRGRGPDVIALVEVESSRAVTLLKDAMNKKLANQALSYKYTAFKDVKGGRHIAPAVISRVPIVSDRVRLHGRTQRVLEAHLRVQGIDLALLTTHWTSRITDRTGEKRGKYGDLIYGIFKGMFLSNPQVDFLVCGDFNDTPEGASVVDHLHARAELEAVMRATSEPLLFNLFASRAVKGVGSHYSGGKWYLFDQIAVSRGMLDQVGWSCDPNSAAVVPTPPRPGVRKTPHPPWRFGGPHDKGTRGYSDHFPVTVQLRVHGP